MPAVAQHAGWVESSCMCSSQLAKGWAQGVHRSPTGQVRVCVKRLPLAGPWMSPAAFEPHPAPLLVHTHSARSSQGCDLGNCIVMNSGANQKGQMLQGGHWQVTRHGLKHPL